MFFFFKKGYHSISIYEKIMNLVFLEFSVSMELTKMYDKHFWSAQAFGHFPID